MRVSGGLLGNITIIFIPLLTLSADVLEKFKIANNTFGEVNVSHLDELLNVKREQYRSVLSSVGAIHRGADSPHFIFVSPQFLVKHSDARDDVLVDAVCRRVVGLVIMDEVHVHVQHGTSFREDVRKLRDIYFLE